MTSTPELTRRGLFQASAAAGLAALPDAASLTPTATLVPTVTPSPTVTPTPTPAPTGPILKPLPPELFTVFGTNAETKWEALRGQGYHTPIDRFFVRNHTATPTIDARTWRLKLFGSGLRGNLTSDQPVEFSYADLLALPAHEVSAFIECTGNGRSFYTSQQSQTGSGTAWKLGAVGVARWRGVRLATVLRRAGLTGTAVDMMPTRLDNHFVSGGIDLGPVRRPATGGQGPGRRAAGLRDERRSTAGRSRVPVRLVVPSWIGIASIKWVGEIEVSDQPSSRPGIPSSTAFSGRTGWLRWEFDWRPRTAGNHELLARATDDTGATQPDIAAYNTLGYLFGAVVRHPVTVS